jgi:hypothetical protein
MSNPLKSAGVFIFFRFFSHPAFLDSYTLIDNWMFPGFAYRSKIALIKGWEIATAFQPRNVFARSTGIKKGATQQTRPDYP